MSGNGAQRLADSRVVFRARCFARALLYANGWLDFDDEVDELQRFAEAHGFRHCGTSLHPSGAMR